MSEEKDWKKGDKRSAAIEIMKDFMVRYPEGHSYNECTKAIRDSLFAPADDEEADKKALGKACSYYNYIVKEKMIVNFVMGKKDNRKPRTKVAKEEKSATTEKRGTPERLALMKKIASQRKNKLPTLEEATKEIEALAAAGAQYQYAETEETSKSLEPA